MNKVVGDESSTLAELKYFCNDFMLLMSKRWMPDSPKLTLFGRRGLLNSAPRGPSVWSTAHAQEARALTVADRCCTSPGRDTNRDKHGTFTGLNSGTDTGTGPSGPVRGPGLLLSLLSSRLRVRLSLGLSGPLQDPRRPVKPPPPRGQDDVQSHRGHRGRSLRSSVCGLLFLLRPETTERPELQDQTQTTEKTTEDRPRKSRTAQAPRSERRRGSSEVLPGGDSARRELLAQGEFESCVEHLSSAIAVCGQPQQLLQVLQQTLPPPVFQMLLSRLPSVSQRISSAQSLSEEDIE
ncbi:hypothetical protein WMY93_006814 [Mugilogobius chulae]|uniref:Mitochondrial import receptor subunit TOM20 homolog n=1 Tax=Mugilogobius chulae TaxID=88201 RepID=A0AAW0PPD7_9GOBI